jgi:hypothetical protein
MTCCGGGPSRLIHLLIVVWVEYLATFTTIAELASMYDLSIANSYETVR